MVQPVKGHGEHLLRDELAFRREALQEQHLQVAAVMSGIATAVKDTLVWQRLDALVHDL